MKPLHVSIGNLALKVLPDVQAHADGHAVLTYTYHLFKDDLETGNTGGPVIDITLQLNSANTSYLGYITFDHPGRMFTYTSNGENELDSEEIEQIIEHITYYRDHPELWRY